MTEVNKQGSGLEPNVAACLCYVCGWITGLIFLLVEKDSAEVKFHAWQSILLNVAVIAYFFVTAVISAIPFLSALVVILNSLVSLGVFVLFIFLMIWAYQGKRLKLPIIGDIAEKQAAK
jgi:uncharacterized membrane protein